MGLDEEIEEAIRHLSAKDRAREEAIKLSREVLRLSTEATRLVLMGKREEALAKMAEAKRLYGELVERLRDHPDILYGGLLGGCAAELVEAFATYHAVYEKRIPGRAELGVDFAAYLLGLGDAVGELRRYALDQILRGNVEEAEEIVKLMDSIYMNLRRVNFPDALVPGLRHKVDVARRLVEDTLELIIYARGARLRQARLSESG